MERAILSMRVKTLDQHPETQLHDIRPMGVVWAGSALIESTQRQ
jgi:hypothetical protein